MRNFLIALGFLAVLCPTPAAAFGDVDSLMFRLRDESPFARFRIIEELGLIGSPEAIDALISLFSDENLRWMAVRQIATLDAQPQLLEALKSRDEDTQRFAIYALGEMRAAEAVPSIMKFLDHPNSEIRQNAVFALGMIRAEEATDRLIDVLSDEDPVVRSYAASALGEIGNPRAKEALMKALRKEDASVVNMATSLMSLGSDQEQVVEILIGKLRDPNPNNRIYAVYALGRIGDAAHIEPLIKVLGNEEIGWLAAQALVGIGEEAVEPLLEALFSEERDVRLYATYALGEIRDARSGRGFLRMFRDEDPLVRKTAAKALVRLGDPALIPAISRELSNPEAKVRMEALDVLGKIGDPSLADTLSSHLSDPDIDVVKSAILALGNLGSAKACPSLRNLLGSERQDVQDALRTAFINIGRDAVPCLAEGLRQEGTAAEAQTIILLGRLKATETVGDLLPYLRHPEPTFRRLATVALTEIGDPRAEEYFLSLLSDPDPTLRMYASIGLMNIGGRIAIKLLLTSLSAPETHWLAVKILDQIGERDVDSLIEALKDERTRWYASQKLVELDGTVLPQLEEGLRSDDPATRESIAMVLGEVKDRRAVRPLLDALRNEDRFVMSSASSLMQIGDPNSVEPLIDLLSSRNEQVRLYAAYALGGLNDSRAVEPLIALFEDPDSSIRGIAALSLGQLGSREATLPLLGLLEDPAENVRVSAVRSLGRLHDRRAVSPLRKQLAEDASGAVRKAAREVLDSFVYQGNQGAR